MPGENLDDKVDGNSQGTGGQFDPDLHPPETGGNTGSSTGPEENKDDAPYHRGANYGAEYKR
jgi:hypothetical protein